MAFPELVSGLEKIRVRGHLNYSEIIHRFERQSTFHGISHAALAPNAKWRFIWYTAFTVCVCALLIQIVLLIRRYRLYAKTVDLDLKFENAPFPSVTLCNLNPYKASVVQQEDATKAMIDAFSNIVHEGGGTFGLSASIKDAHSRKEFSASNRRREKRSKISDEDDDDIVANQIRRYHQAYARCLCQVNSITGQRQKGSCFAAYKGNISISLGEQIHRLHPSECICQLDWVSKILWPCFPYNTWKERLCTQCSSDLGHCPMIFYEGNSESFEIETDVCLCHKEYNHCIANNQYGYILSIDSKADLSGLNVSPESVGGTTTTTTTSTQEPAVKKALGFEGLQDEIAIVNQAKENLMFAVGEMTQTKRVSLSQTKEEFILKCSFNQKDCDIEKDFVLHYDPTYGNCFTFNWNRTKAVTAHRAGANYGLKVLLFADVAEYLPTSDTVGFRITVHDKWTVPFPDAFGYNAPTGFLSSFGVRMKQFNRIPPPHGQCLDDHNNTHVPFLYENFSYSVEGCQRSCTQKEVIKECGCGDPMYPIPHDSKPCRVNDPMARDCIRRTSIFLGQLIAEGNVPDCVCHQPCKETNYEVTYSAARWPSGTTKVMECSTKDDLCLEHYRKNAAMVQIFYEELNYETMTETPAYTISSALADLGGLTGLWIGASVVSLLEIAALIVYTVQAYVRKKRQKQSIMNNVATPMIYPKYPKPSRTSLSSNRSTRFRISLDSMEKSNLSTQSKTSFHEDVEKCLETIQDEDDEISDESVDGPPRRLSYLPPGAELPCDCIYNAKGTIKIMNALCPEHGYLVRRGANYFVYRNSDDENSVDMIERPGSRISRISRASKESVSKKSTLDSEKNRSFAESLKSNLRKKYSKV